MYRRSECKEEYWDTLDRMSNTNFMAGLRLVYHADRELRVVLLSNKKLGQGLVIGIKRIRGGSIGSIGSPQEFS